VGLHKSVFILSSDQPYTGGLGSATRPPNFLLGFAGLLGILPSHTELIIGLSDQSPKNPLRRTYPVLTDLGTRGPEMGPGSG